MEKFWANGIKFECQGSGNCCVSRGGYGYVYVNKEDRRRLAGHLGLSTTVFTKRYCDQLNEVWKLKNSAECLFLKDSRCSVYKARPTQCRTWPFWPETLKPRAWNEEVAKFCPGVGKGKVWSAQEVEMQLSAQKKSEEGYGT